MWVPPLYSYHNSSITVDGYYCKEPIITYLRRASSRGVKVIDMPTSRIHLHVSVQFFDQSNDQAFAHPFHGFHLSKILPKSDIQTLHLSIIRQDLIPFLFNYPCCWTEYEDGGRRSRPPEYPSTEEQLVRKISDFVSSVEDKPEKDVMKVVGIYITKRVQVPTEEFKSWTDWYQEQKRVNPNFEEEYRKAIRRPRNGNDLFQEVIALERRRPASLSSIRELPVMVNNNAAESCCICLEEFGAEAEVIKLPCGHFFHHQCVLRWLRENGVCPFCRHQLPVDH